MPLQRLLFKITAQRKICFNHTCKNLNRKLITKTANKKGKKIIPNYFRNPEYVCMYI